MVEEEEVTTDLTVTEEATAETEEVMEGTTEVVEALVVEALVEEALVEEALEVSAVL